jgi:hypothetical protein
MSWGAHALRLTDVYGDGAQMWLMGLPKTDSALPVFKAASEQLSAQGVWGIDGSLEDGGLCSKASANAIKKATGITPYGYKWTAEEVKDIAARADWSFPVDAAEQGAEGAKQSAKAFFDVCVEQNLGMCFD